MSARGRLEDDSGGGNRRGRRSTRSSQPHRGYSMKGLAVPHGQVGGEAWGVDGANELVGIIGFLDTDAWNEMFANE